MAKSNPVTAEELHAIADNIEDWGMTCVAAADRMLKVQNKELGDVLALTSKLSYAAEHILALNRQVLASARMNAHADELETKLRERAKSGSDQ